MGGKILVLESERLQEQGRQEGQQEGRHKADIQAIQNMMDLGLSKEQILTKYTLKDFEEAERTKIL